jgi:hypothetical protein
MVNTPARPLTWQVLGLDATRQIVYRRTFNATTEDEALMMAERDCAGSVDIVRFTARLATATLKVGR